MMTTLKFTLENSSIIILVVLFVDYIFSLN